ncbi:MAG TPA: GNAT family N-acetyltransferase [Bryobacteraceae bacterium]|nr:GNAT family N-acetyltransferase [Bryobacteraceae bacterium]
MAALPDRHFNPSPRGSLIDLRDLQPEHLAPLLDEEIESWRSGLDWDFRASADLVKRFVQVRALNGFALVEGEARNAHVAGYGYYVVEEGKGLIGDFYVRAAERTQEAEYRLLEAALESMWRTPGVRRVEAQLMMLSSYQDRPIPFPRWFRQFPRHFMQAPAIAGRLRPSGQTIASIHPWAAQFNEEAARLISQSYRGHVDSLINDQYRSPAGAHRFLVNIVQFPGCGMFFAPASFVARDHTGSLCGLSLASLISPDVGHITQICVSPTHRGTKLGYELLRRSIEALAANNCRSVTLTVTVGNDAAIDLYEAVGFRTRRDFAAWVWDMA